MAHTTRVGLFESTTVNGTEAVPEQRRDAQWERLVDELRACQSQPSTEEEIDELAIARYLSGECSDQEREEIDAAIKQSSGLAKCIALTRELFNDRESAA
ncbi:MAG: hypothetical protein HQ567_04185 [Candidatus Nealsonbacteria bacterium]|nr:hypothetical protein [Candidatus Nealsonbacteria bacterium]